MAEILIICILFFLISLIYSSAGFGGGSSYLAILSLFSVPFVDLRIIALVCNIVVVSSSVYLFHKNELINWKKVLPLIICSVPFAFIGGRFLLQESHFFILLGFSLLAASIFMMLDRKSQVLKVPNYFNAIIGSGIGFLSGLVGIGGGIFLSPVLHLSRWDTVKTIASTSALFILVNSIAGLLGQWSIHYNEVSLYFVAPLMIAALIGGQIGVRTTIFKLEAIMIRRITAVVILIIAIRILIKYIF